MRRRPDQLTTGEWAVLGLVAEGPTHGFAVARALEPGGEVGRVWSMRRPLVYRTLDVLEGRELTLTAGTEASTAGPQRTLVDVTAERPPARRRLAGRAGRARPRRPLDAAAEAAVPRPARVAPDALLDAQRVRFREQESELRARLDDADGFARTLALWRVENTAAAVRFVDALHSSARAS